MKKYLWMSAFLAAFWVVAAGPVSGQNEDDDINYSYGALVSQSPDKIVVLEYDYDRDEEIQVVYELTPETKVENVDALDKLQKNDNIEVYYKDVGGKKVAVSIEKELVVDDTTLVLPDELTEDIVPEEYMEDMNGAVPQAPAAEEQPATAVPAEPVTAQ